MGLEMLVLETELHCYSLVVERSNKQYTVLKGERMAAGECVSAELLTVSSAWSCTNISGLVNNSN